MKIKKLAFVLLGTILFIGAVGAAALYGSPDFRQSVARLGGTSNEKIWQAVSCRTSLYLQKAQGGIPELSWSELWGLTSTGTGFHCADGRSLEASLDFSSSAGTDDLRAGARIFHERCSGCHGSDGSGGPHAPSLTRPEFKHGDSDLAVYKVIRDGVPGTAMPSAGLPLRELLQVTANVKMLQARLSVEHDAGSPRLAIQVSGERLVDAGAGAEDWLTYSGSYDGWRHSALAEITPANVAQLRVRWIKQFDSNEGAIEATPLAVGGALFMAASVSNVAALDAKTGEQIWEYQRPIPADVPVCCGRVNRGLAIHGDTVFFGSLDGYLVAINANDGKVKWQTVVASPSGGYSMTGAPLVVNNSVVVGVAGGDLGIRGFLAAYDISTGRQLWKFETIPGPGEVGHETWESDAWRTGGGGTWNTGAYDPTTDLLYWGVGNPTPAFSGDTRPGDNLFTDSVIALHASTGKLAWHFQFTPHDEHDWDSAQNPVLADLPIDGKIRKVMCWLNRNGFYYVLDRVTGEFLLGVPFVELDWAQGLTATGRPILSDAAKVSTAGRRTRPGVNGGTNWQNPAFDQKRGSIFVPTTEGSSVFTKAAVNRAARGQNGPYFGSGWNQLEPQTVHILALDAATGQRRWKYSPSSSGRHYSGLLATEGGLVFGASGGMLFALDADTGREIWRLSLGGNTAAPPISFMIDGHQAIAVAAGRALFVFGL